MTKWEYLRLYVEYLSYLDADFGKVKCIYSNAVKVFDDYKNPIHVHDYINKLGEESWELVSVNRTSDLEIFHFKRSLRE